MSTLDGDGPCTDCGTIENIIWFTHDHFWNMVCRPPGYEKDPTLCIRCFVRRAEQVGYRPVGWELEPRWPYHMEEDGL